MQRLEVSGAVRPIYGSLGVKRLIFKIKISTITLKMKAVCFFETSAKVTQIHGATTQKSWFLNSHSVETSNHRFVLLRMHIHMCL